MEVAESGYTYRLVAHPEQSEADAAEYVIVNFLVGLSSHDTVCTFPDPQQSILATCWTW